MKKLILILLCLISTIGFGQVNYRYFTKSELMQDLDFFSEKLTNIHPIFLDTLEYNHWQNKLSTMKNSLKDSMTQNEFYLFVSPQLASVNDGHSGFAIPYDQRIQYNKDGGTAFPFFVEIKDYSIFNKFYCGNDSTLFHGGEEIVKINGMSCADMVKEMQELFGIKSLAIRQNAVAHNFKFYLWMFYGFEKDYELGIRNKQNQIQNIIVPGVSSQDFRHNIKRMSKANDEQYAFSIDKNRKTAILKIKSFGNLDRFCSFADSTFSKIEKNKIENLVIDVRGNGGGRSVVVDSLMNYLTTKEYELYQKIEIRISEELKERYRDKYPERYDWINSYVIDDLVIPELNGTKPFDNKLRFKGKLYLLTDKTTFSAAATFAGIFKELKLGTIIGEETGGTIGYYGDFWFLKTPNTAVNFYIAPKRFIQYGGTDLDRGVIPEYIIKDDGNSILDFTYGLIKNNEMLVE